MQKSNNIFEFEFESTVCLLQYKKSVCLSVLFCCWYNSSSMVGGERDCGTVNIVPKKVERDSEKIKMKTRELMVTAERVFSDYHWPVSSASTDSECVVSDREKRCINTLFSPSSFIFCLLIRMIVFKSQHIANGRERDENSEDKQF